MNIETQKAWGQEVGVREKGKEGGSGRDRRMDGGKDGRREAGRQAGTSRGTSR